MPMSCMISKKKLKSASRIEIIGMEFEVKNQTPIPINEHTENTMKFASIKIIFPED